MVGLARGCGGLGCRRSASCSASAKAESGRGKGMTLEAHLAAAAVHTVASGMGAGERSWDKAGLLMRAVGPRAGLDGCSSCSPYFFPFLRLI
jgi:hypothetical protein